MEKIIEINTLEQLNDFAQQLAQFLPSPAWVYLQGDLGTGKTTFSQYFIYHKGYQGAVTSPTYAIMQDYNTDSGWVIHSDLYRLADPEELYEIGLMEDSYDKSAICLIEWPSKGKGVLPSATVILSFHAQQQQRHVVISADETLLDCL